MRLAALDRLDEADKELGLATTQLQELETVRGGGLMDDARAKLTPAILSKRKS